jgi:hypothetical protein
MRTWSLFSDGSSLTAALDRLNSGMPSSGRKGSRTNRSVDQPADGQELTVELPGE